MIAFAPLLHASLSSGVSLFDNFTSYNSSIWTYDDGKGGDTDGCKVWYLKNHTTVDAHLSMEAGTGLRMLMSSTPCVENPATCTNGAKMAADHLSSIENHHYGVYELRMRAPYTVNGTGGTWRDDYPHVHGAAQSRGGAGGHGQLARMGGGGRG